MIFFNFSKNFFLLVWDGVVRKRGWMYIFFVFFLCDMVTLSRFFSRFFFININIFFWGMEKFQHKNITKRINNIFKK